MKFIIRQTNGNTDVKHEYANISNFIISDGILALYRKDKDDNDIVVLMISINTLLYATVSHDE